LYEKWGGQGGTKEGNDKTERKKVSDKTENRGAVVNKTLKTWSPLYPKKRKNDPESPRKNKEKKREGKNPARRDQGGEGTREWLENN